MRNRGMIHGFGYMGVPEIILTDNMKSVVIRRTSEGYPVWQKDYEAFMKTVGFATKLCKPRHPFTKGAVERLIRFVKDNFLADCVFGTLTGLNRQALEWCASRNGAYRPSVDGIPHQLHDRLCARRLHYGTVSINPETGQLVQCNPTKSVVREKAEKDARER